MQCGILYKLKCSCGHSYIGQTQSNLKFCLDERNPLKSNHQTTDVVKHLYTYPGHFTDFENPEILASAFNYREFCQLKRHFWYKNSNLSLMETIFHPFIPLEYVDYYAKYLTDAHFLCWYTFRALFLLLT